MATMAQQASQQPKKEDAKKNPVANQPVVSKQGATSQQKGIEATESVSENLGQLLDEGGAYLTQARQQGQSAAARRGLGGSSIAAQAAQGSAIQAAAPIASQEAQLKQTSRLEAERLASQEKLAEMQIQSQKEMQASQFEFQGEQAGLDRLLQQQTQDKQLAAQQQQLLIQLQAQREEAEKNRDFEEAERLKQLEAEKEAQLREIEARQAELDKQIQAEKDRLSDTVTQNLKGQYNTAVQNVLREAQISINAIETNANLRPEEKDKMINNILARQKTDINFINNLYNNMPEWNTDWTVLPPPIPPSGLTGKDKEEADKAYQDALDDWSNKWNPNYKPGETGDIKPPPQTDGTDTTRPEEGGSGNDGLYEGDKGGR